LSGHIKAVAVVLPVVHPNDLKRTAEIRHLVEANDSPLMDVEAMSNSN
jgi:hypothetical protein